MHAKAFQEKIYVRSTVKIQNKQSMMPFKVIRQPTVLRGLVHYHMGLREPSKGV